jgi:hypothetical protein
MAKSRKEKAEKRYGLSQRVITTKLMLPSDTPWRSVQFLRPYQHAVFGHCPNFIPPRQRRGTGAALAFGHDGSDDHQDLAPGSNDHVRPVPGPDVRRAVERPQGAPFPSDETRWRAQASFRAPSERANLAYRLSAARPAARRWSGHPSSPDGCGQRGGSLSREMAYGGSMPALRARVRLSAYAVRRPSTLWTRISRLGRTLAGDAAQIFWWEMDALVHQRMCGPVVQGGVSARDYPHRRLRFNDADVNRLERINCSRSAISRTAAATLASTRTAWAWPFWPEVQPWVWGAGSYVYLLDLRIRGALPRPNVRTEDVGGSIKCRPSCRHIRRRAKRLPPWPSLPRSSHLSLPKQTRMSWRP